MSEVPLYWSEGGLGWHGSARVLGSEGGGERLRVGMKQEGRY